MDRTNRRGLVAANCWTTTRHTISMPNARCWRCVLLDPGCIAEVAASLEPADFAGEANRTIYEAMLRLHSAGKPVDVTLLGRRASRSRPVQRGERRFGGNAGRAVSAGAVGSRTAAVPFPCFGNLPPTLFAGIAYRLVRWALLSGDRRCTRSAHERGEAAGGESQQPRPDAVADDEEGTRGEPRIGCR